MGLKAVQSFEHRFDERLMDAAKRKSLLNFLDVNEIPYFKQGAGHASRYCPHCGQSTKESNKCNISNELWSCFACGRGGSVVDYARYLWHVDAIDAAKQLINAEITPAVLKPGVKSEASVSKEVDLSGFYRKMQREGKSYHKTAFTYLTKERCIPEEIVIEAVRRGILRFLPEGAHEATKWLREVFGEGELRRMGFWNEGKKMPWIVFRPIIFIYPSYKTGEWRIDHAPKTGERKSVRFGIDKSCLLWKGKNPEKVSVVEGPMDLLSMAALGWDGDIKGLPGTGCWEDEWLDGYHRAVFTLDNDPAGLLAMKKMSEAAEAKNIRFAAKAPPAGDVNEELKQRRLMSNKST